MNGFCERTFARDRGDVAGGQAAACREGARDVTEHGGRWTSASRLEELDGIPVRIFDLNLSTSRAGLHLVAEPKSRVLQFSDEPRQIGDLQDDPVPAAALL